MVEGMLIAVLRFRSALQIAFCVNNISNIRSEATHYIAGSPFFMVWGMLIAVLRFRSALQIAFCVNNISNIKSEATRHITGSLFYYG